VKRTAKKHSSAKTTSKKQPNYNTYEITIAGK
jgi:hypothetical protein